MGIFKNIQENLGIGRYDPIKRAEREIKERNKRWEEADRRREERMAEYEYERRQREATEQEKKERLKREHQQKIKDATILVNKFKEKVDPYLSNFDLIKASGEKVNLESVKFNGDQKISKSESEEIDRECKELNESVEEICEVLLKLDCMPQRDDNFIKDIDELKSRAKELSFNYNYFLLPFGMSVEQRPEYEKLANKIHEAKFKDELAEDYYEYMTMSLNAGWDNEHIIAGIMSKEKINKTFGVNIDLLITSYLTDVLNGKKLAGYIFDQG